MVSWELWERRRKYFVEVNFDPFDPASNVTRYIERRSQSEVMHEVYMYSNNSILHKQHRLENVF